MVRALFDSTNHISKSLNYTTDPIWDTVWSTKHTSYLLVHGYQGIYRDTTPQIIDDHLYKYHNDPKSELDTEFIYSHLNYLMSCAIDSVEKYRKKVEIACAKGMKATDNLIAMHFLQEADDNTAKREYWEGRYEALIEVLYPKYRLP